MENLDDRCANKRGAGDCEMSMKLHLWKMRLDLSDYEMKVLKTLLDHTMKDTALSRNISSGYDEDIAILGVIHGKVTTLDKMSKN